MPRGWIKNVESIVQKGEEKINEAATARLKREAERRKRIDDAKGIVRSCFSDVVDLLQRYNVKATIIEDEDTLLLKMPDLSEVNRANLLFEFTCRPASGTWKVFITAFKIDAETPSILSEFKGEGDVEEFTARAVEEFIEGWYKRKLSDELNKEREWELKISSVSLKEKGE